VTRKLRHTTNYDVWCVVYVCLYETDWLTDERKNQVTWLSVSLTRVFFLSLSLSLSSSLSLFSMCIVRMCVFKCVRPGYGLKTNYKEGEVYAFGVWALSSSTELTTSTTTAAHTHYTLYVVRMCVFWTLLKTTTSSTFVHAKARTNWTETEEREILSLEFLTTKRAECAWVRMCACVCVYVRKTVSALAVLYWVSLMLK